jgi:hypothetical protein
MSWKGTVKRTGINKAMNAQATVTEKGSSEKARATAQDEDLNPFHIAQQQFDTAVNYLPQLHHGLVEFLMRPERMVMVEFPIEVHEGHVRNFVG